MPLISLLACILPVSGCTKPSADGPRIATTIGATAPQVSLAGFGPARQCTRRAAWSSAKRIGCETMCNHEIEK